MCELATKTSKWIMVDGWEANQTTYQTTMVVLEHFYKNVCYHLKREDIILKLVCGADLLQSFNIPGVWAPEDVN